MATPDERTSCGGLASVRVAEENDRTPADRHCAGVEEEVSTLVQERSEDGPDSHLQYGRRLAELDRGGAHR